LIVNAKLLSVATKVPPHCLKTTDVMREAASVFGNWEGEFARMLPVFANTGIERRYAVRPYDWFRQPLGWPERSAAFLDGACRLFREAACEALARADLAAAEIDTIVTVCSTGIATPSIEAHVMHELGFRVDVRRVPVFGLGCAGGVTGLALAARLARADPGSRVLLVVIELCTLAFRADEMSRSNIVATALFGDGAAACVVSTGGDGMAAIEHAGEHTWPGTLDVMGWRIDPQGFGAIFAQSIPDLVGRDMRGALDAFLTRHGLTLADVENFSLHPGGAKVVTALERAFDLNQGTLAGERAVLRDFGNMSAATVLFVLERALAQPASGRRLMASLGPGFTGSFLTMLQ
jgi:alkylresorcinol/alkylpyrone synthase